MKRNLFRALALVLAVATPLHIAIADSPNDAPVAATTTTAAASETGLLKGIFNSIFSYIGSLTGGTAASKSVAVGGVYNSSAPTLTNGQQAGLQLDGAGNLKVGGGLAQGAATSGALGDLVFCAIAASASASAGNMEPLWCDTNGRLQVLDPNTATISTNTGAGATALGTPADTAWTSGSGSVIAILKALVAKFTFGSAVSASSLPVVIASDQAAVAVKQSTPANLQAEVGGLVANGASVSGNPLQNGGRAQNAEITPVTNGQEVAQAYDLAGKAIVMPYANKENFLSGAASATGTTQTTLIAAQGSGVKIYVTAVQCFNIGSTTSTIAFNDGSTWTGVNVALGGFGFPFPTPLVVAANTALKFTPGSSSSTQYCNAQGYAGS